MRSDLHLETAEAGFEWKRISHIDRPNRSGWEDMAGVWKARAEWINRDNLEQDESTTEEPDSTSASEWNCNEARKNGYRGDEGGGTAHWLG